MMDENDALCLALILLLAKGDFKPKRELAEALGISEEKLKQLIKALIPLGCKARLDKQKGYYLLNPLDLLSNTLLSTALPEIEIHYLPIIDSTNQYLLNKKQEPPIKRACLAEYQKAGRGRRGRKWHSPFGVNLYLSLSRRFHCDIQTAMGLSLVVGIALAETLVALGVKDIKLKWPNDVYWQGRKLAGILVEMTQPAPQTLDCVLGLGLNLSMPDTTDVDQPWVNLREACPNMPDKNTLVIILIKKIYAALDEFEQKGLMHFLSSWRQFDFFYQRAVTVFIDNQTIKGIACGIDAKGALLVEVKGQLFSFTHGEISVRPDIKRDTKKERSC